MIPQEIVLKRDKENFQQTKDNVHTYLREVGRVPLLSHEEEIQLGKQVQQVMFLLQTKDALAQKLHREPTLEEWALHVQLSATELSVIVQRGERAKKKMIEANLRLVVAIAKKYQHRGLELLDLIQEGTIGLQRGVEKFDPTKGYRFSTYAYHWIRQAITRLLSQQPRIIRLPSHITEKLNKIKKAQRELAQKFGRSPSQTEIAKKLRLKPAQIKILLNLARQPVSLNVRVGDNQNTELQDLLENEGPSPEHYMTQESMRQDLYVLLAKLTPQQRQVLSLRFGLEDGNELSLAKIGDRLNLSRERIRQLEQQAIRHLHAFAQLDQAGAQTTSVMQSVPDHEAITPTDLTASSVSQHPEQLKLFDLLNGQVILHLDLPSISAA